MLCPVQVWSPICHWGLVDGTLQADLQRAQMASTNEDLVWLCRGLAKATTWIDETGRRFLAQPAMQNNFVAVYNIDGTRQIHRRDFLPLSWKGKVPDRLFMQWLNSSPVPENLPDQCEILMPALIDGKVALDNGTLRQQYTQLSTPLGAFLRITKETATDLGLGAPPFDGLVPLIGSLLGSGHYYQESNRTRFEHDKKTYDALSWDRDGKVGAVRVGLKWPSPLSGLFVDGGGPDVFLHHQVIMRECFRIYDRGDIPRALRIACAWAGRLGHMAYVPWQKIFFETKSAGQQKDILSYLHESSRIQTFSLKEIDEDEDFSAIREGLLPVWRTNGWLGYFWWELLNEIQNHGQLRVCKRCGQLITGTARRLFCSKKENIKCYRARNASHRKGSRQRAQK